MVEIANTSEENMRNGKHFGSAALCAVSWYLSWMLEAEAVILALGHLLSSPLACFVRSWQSGWEIVLHYVKTDFGERGRRCDKLEKKRRVVRRDACLLVADDVTGDSSNSDEHDGCKLPAWRGPGSRVTLVFFAVALPTESRIHVAFTLHRLPAVSLATANRCTPTQHPARVAKCSASLTITT